MIRMARPVPACDSGRVALPPLVRSITDGAERILDRVLCVVGAVAFSQFPEFMQQYLQRLEGHLDEARLALERLKDLAAQSGMTLDQLEAGAAQNPDRAMGSLGGIVRAASARVQELGMADQALRQASAWTRPFAFLRHLDWGIARATLSIYRPAVPTTAEGLVYAAAGMIAVLCVYHLLVRGPVVRALGKRPVTQPPAR